MNFYLPASNISRLRKVPGFENFDPQTEVLHCDKPGTGLTDAPRAFSIKIKAVTDDKCHTQASLVDSEMCVKHKATQQLIAMLTKHVDDIKMTGESAECKNIIGHLHDTLGELNIEWFQFTNCGLHHYQDQISRDVNLDQADYVQRLRPIVHSFAKWGAR